MLLKYSKITAEIMKMEEDIQKGLKELGGMLG